MPHWVRDFHQKNVEHRARRTQNREIELKREKDFPREFKRLEKQATEQIDEAIREFAELEEFQVETFAVTKRKNHIRIEKTTEPTGVAELIFDPENRQVRYSWSADGSMTPNGDYTATVSTGDYGLKIVRGRTPLTIDSLVESMLKPLFSLID